MPAALDFTSLTFTDVSHHFGRRRALSRASLGCGAGEVVALLGPNGAGKSTLLAIAATLLSPASGTVAYGDHTARAGAPLRARIGLLGHDLFLYPELSAAENLAFFGRLAGVPDVDARVAAALARAGLSARADDPVSGYSRGMRQRVAIERAILHEPRLVLLDEPFTGLDEASTVVLQRRIGDLRARGCIVVVTTHDMETVEAVADRAVLLIGGRVAPLAGSGGRLRERYRAAVQAAEGGARGTPGAVAGGAG